MKFKKIKHINTGTGEHWVGDGFPVNTMFSYDPDGSEISPFLLLDYAGPAEFEPSNRPRGVGQHPHRGFETVTIVYEGEVEHKDSAGNAGHIGPGDVQWMTAARGILHEEMHSREFTKTGGTLEMVQLWVNLPAKYKMSNPHYQEIMNDEIPVLTLPDGISRIRLIAGEYNRTQGAAKTFTPVNLWDMRLRGNHETALTIPEGHNSSLLVLSGKVIVNKNKTVNSKELIQFSRAGEGISLEVQEDSVVLLMSGEPIEEPVVGYGPFVMNSAEEIRTAIEDFSAGRFG